MSNLPKFVEIVRSNIPKEGLQTDRPDRLKSKIKKALDKANIPSKTLRSIGRQVGDFAIVYSIKDGLLHADFEKMVDLNSRMPDRGKRGKKRNGTKKDVNIFTGVHPSVGDMNLGEYTSLIEGHLPRDWEKSDELAHRWLSTDVSLLLNTQHTPFMASRHFVNQASQHLSKASQIYYTVIKAFDQILIGIGPA